MLLEAVIDEFVCISAEDEIMLPAVIVPAVFNPTEAEISPEVLVILPEATIAPPVFSPPEDEITPLEVMLPFDKNELPEIIPKEVMFEPACIVPAVFKATDADTCPITVRLLFVSIEPVN